MAKKENSSRKRTAKVASRTRSTTSSTTAKTKRTTKKKTTQKTNRPEPQSTTKQLSPELQNALSELLLRGASPFGACKQLGISLDDVKQSYTNDVTFRRQVDLVPDVLSQNVAAALYREAMEGNVSAQVFWLKTLPPPGWQQATTGPIPRTFDETLDQLTDEELFELARAMGVYLPHENNRIDDVTLHQEIAPDVP